MKPIFEQFELSAKKSAEKIAVRYIKDGNIHSWTYRELLDLVREFARGLKSLGLKKGDRIAMVTANGPYWPVVDLGIAKEGMILVPIHTTLSEEQLKKVLRDSKVQTLLVGDGLGGKLPALLKDLPDQISTVLMMEEVWESHPPAEGRAHYSVQDILAKGRRAGPDGEVEPPVELGDICTIMYTSGTTGEMKGVVLTHSNLVHNAVSANHMAGTSQHQNVLSVLPLSHAFERAAGLLEPLFFGFTINYGRSIEDLSEDIKILKPTRMNVVPRLLEKLREGILNGIQKKSTTLARVFKVSLKSSQHYHAFRQKHNPLSVIYFFPNQLARLLFYRKIQEKLGGQLDILVCGGAPLNPTVAKFFVGLGIRVQEGYGLTECSPCVTINPLNQIRIGSVGRPIPQVQVKIGENDEILVKGPNLMKGYEGNPEATREVIDVQGWFHTGDQGYLDKDGYLYVKGRVKELIVTSYGKNIIPNLVEQAIEKSPLISQSIVFGHAKPYLVGLLVIDPKAISKLAESEGVRTVNGDNLQEHPKILARIEKEISSRSQGLAHHEQIKKFKIITEEFSQENNLLTPTLKLKRPKIAERYSKEIASLY